MGNIFKMLMSPIVFLFKTIDGAREYIENKLADVLDNVQESETIDEIEKKLITTGLELGLLYFLGNCPLKQEHTALIADSIVEKGINKINPKISKQLRK